MARNFQLAEDFIDAHPEAAARVLEEQSPDSASVVVDAIADELSMKALANMLPYHAARCLQRLSTDSAAKYLGGIAPPLAATILRHTSPDYRAGILDAMPRNARIRVRTILRYARSTVGAWTDTRVLTARLDLSAGDALARFRSNEDIVHPSVYVVDEKRKFCGWTDIASLLRAPEERALREIMRPATHQIRSSATLDSILFHAGWDTEDHLPVTDRSDVFMGVLRHVDLRKAVTTHTPNEVQDTGPGSILDLTNIWYLGMADLITASFAPDIFRAPGRS